MLNAAGSRKKRRGEEKRGRERAKYEGKRHTEKGVTAWDGKDWADRKPVVPRKK